MTNRGRNFDAVEWEESMPTCGGDMDCNLGQMCPCWESGAECGEQEGELREQEAAVGEALQVAVVDIGKVFDEAIHPLQHQMDWHGANADPLVQSQILALQQLKKKVLEVVS